MNKAEFCKVHTNPQPVSPTHTIRIIERVEWIDKCKGWEVQQKRERVLSEWLFLDGFLGLVVEDDKGVLVAQIFLDFYSKAVQTRRPKFYYQWVKTGGFWVSPPYRFLGIGTKIMEYIVKTLPKYNIEQIHSTPLSTAYPIFKKLGFELWGEDDLGEVRMWEGRLKYDSILI